MAKNEVTPINPTTYEVELAGGDKVEIGDKEAIDFKPHLKLNRWGGECFINVGLPTAEKITPVVESGGVKWRRQKVETQFYPLEPTTLNELGGFEFEVVLKEKPPTNQIILDIQAQRLRFSYQPPLTQEEIDEGVVRPDNIVGSYAVYHATKKNNQYVTGKAFHIYRPMAIDAIDKKVRCDIQVDKSIDPTSLTITVPQQFLDEAVYPITIDPDFGYTSIGGTDYVIATKPTPAFTKYCYRWGSAWPMPAGGGTANWIKAYIGGSSSCDCKAIINQKDSGGAGSHGQIAGPVENLACAEAFHWEEFTLANEVLTEAINYVLNGVGDYASLALNKVYKVKGDENGAVASYYEAGVVDTTDSYDNPESPWVVDPEGTTRDYSIYCDYSEPVVGLENKSANMGAKMLAGKLI